MTISWFSFHHEILHFTNYILNFRWLGNFRFNMMVLKAFICISPWFKQVILYWSYIFFPSALTYKFVTSICLQLLLYNASLSVLSSSSNDANLVGVCTKWFVTAQCLASCRAYLPFGKGLNHYNACFFKNLSIS